jgi:signal transduction histidine kinase
MTDRFTSADAPAFPGAASAEGATPPADREPVTDDGEPAVFLGRSATWWRWAGIILAAAAAFGLIATVQGYYQATLRGGATDFVRSLKIWLPDYLLWAALTPGVLVAGRRWPVTGPGWVPNLLRHLVLAPLFVLVELLASVWVVGHIVADLPPDNYAGYGEWYLSVIGVYGAWGLLFYAVILAAGHAYHLYRHNRARELEAARLSARASRLEALLSQARLSALTARLQPHFMFNTLNAISELVHRDPEVADRMIVRLGSLLRMVVARTESQWSTVAEELELVDTYLSLERVRYGDRLNVERDVEGGILGEKIPSLALQPLVENAVRHGIAPLSRPGNLTIEIRRRNGHLRFVVRDDGVGLDEDRVDGVGLGTTRRRLRELYGDAFRLELADGGEAGARTILEIPIGGDGGAENPVREGG